MSQKPRIQVAIKNTRNDYQHDPTAMISREEPGQGRFRHGFGVGLQLCPTVYSSLTSTLVSRCPYKKRLRFLCLLWEKTNLQPPIATKITSSPISIRLPGTSRNAQLTNRHHLATRGVASPPKLNVAASHATHRTRYFWYPIPGPSPTSRQAD